MGGRRREKFAQIDGQPINRAPPPFSRAKFWPIVAFPSSGGNTFEFGVFFGPWNDAELSFPTAAVGGIFAGISSAACNLFQDPIEICINFLKSDVGIGVKTAKDFAERPNERQNGDRRTASANRKTRRRRRGAQSTASGG